MKTKLSLLIYLCFTLTLLGQGSTSRALHADYFYGQDNFNSIYYKKNNTLFKQEGNNTYQYSNLGKGIISSVDIANPLGIVILYEDTQEIVLLDNKLNKMNSFSFSQNTPFVAVNNAGYAPLNKLWVFEKSSNRVYLYDTRRIKMEKLTPILPSKICHFQTSLNMIYWVDDNYDWYRCSIYGEIKKIGHLPRFKKMHIIDSKIALLHINDNLYKYHVYSKNFDLIHEGLKDDSSFYYSNQILTIFTDGELTTINTKLD